MFSWAQVILLNLPRNKNLRYFFFWNSGWNIQFNFTTSGWLVLKSWRLTSFSRYEWNSSLPFVPLFLLTLHCILGNVGNPKQRDTERLDFSWTHSNTSLTLNRPGLHCHLLPFFLVFLLHEVVFYYWWIEWNAPPPKRSNPAKAICRRVSGGRRLDVVVKSFAVEHCDLRPFTLPVARNVEHCELKVKNKNNDDFSLIGVIINIRPALLLMASSEGNRPTRHVPKTKEWRERERERRWILPHESSAFPHENNPVCVFTVVAFSCKQKTKKRVRTLRCLDPISLWRRKTWSKDV